MTKKEINQEIRRRFYEMVEEKFPQYEIDDSEGYGRVYLVDGRNAIEYHMSRHTLCGYDSNSEQSKKDEDEMAILLERLVFDYNI